jgi:EAL domain-containing protein (putative c-di-GMP-specific phosphodiesterase class I)
MNARSMERQTLESALRRAAERQQFILHYQPIVNLRSGNVSGLEALIRWRRPGRALVEPARFIALAEQTGLIVPIGRWVMREACRQLRAWRDAGLPPMRIAINVSAVELRDREFVAGVLAALTETGLEPRYLELELTETFLMHDSSSTAGVLHALKGLGVQLALDDFGTGYSSLSHLKRFPIDTLKIDRSFLTDVATNPADASIVSGLISMGRDLGICVVAEGVETREQLAFLHGQGCAEAQGYYFGRPATGPDVPAMLDRRSLEPKSGSLVGKLHGSRGRQLVLDEAVPPGSRAE